MSSIIGAWELQSFVETVGGKVETPFGEHPVGLLVFSHPQGVAPYMGAQLTSKTGAPTFSFSAHFEVISDHSYQFTPVATNNPAKFPIGVTTAPKTYQIQGQIFKQSWVDEGKSIVVTCNPDAKGVANRVRASMWRSGSADSAIKVTADVREIGGVAKLRFRFVWWIKVILIA